MTDPAEPELFPSHLWKAVGPCTPRGTLGGWVARHSPDRPPAAAEQDASLFPCWFCRLAHPHVDKQQGTVGLSGSSHLSPASPQGRRLDLGRVLSLAACPLDSKGSDLVPKGTVWGNRRLFFFFSFLFLKA